MRTTGRRLAAAIVGTVFAAGLLSGVLAGDSTHGSLAKAVTTPVVTSGGTTGSTYNQPKAGADCGTQVNKPRCA
jgi:hypothetical protein